MEASKDALITSGSSIDSINVTSAHLFSREHIHIQPSRMPNRTASMYGTLALSSIQTRQTRTRGPCGSRKGIMVYQTTNISKTNSFYDRRRGHLIMSVISNFP